MKKLIYLVVFAVIAGFALTSCEEESDSAKGTLTLSITDAPIDMSTVSAVYLTINEIQYNKSGQHWMTFEGFEGPQKFNILELTRGESALMGSFELEAGTYTQLRFILDVPEFGTPNPTNPGCYIEFTDGTEQPLFVPSGHESGWKGIGAFKVPSNGEVAVTADFDARKSVMKQGANEFYILKPTIRLIVDNQSGQIAGGITNIPEGEDIIVYAYEDGTYTDAEADEPAADTIARFPNAVTSDITCEEDNYHLAYLAPMTYDLVVTSAIDGEFQQVLGIVEDVVVESRKTTNQPIDIASL
ncbi:MAG: DUF4382 domain-containing protein [Bacteroidales bacterium]|jgi:hypothetical protein|nr:DUF4382 domain-containing protein [Bacteroidales bacterium]